MESHAKPSVQKKRSALTAFSRRLTPVEVARHWFRRGEDFKSEIHAHYPSFPLPGPDGLFLLSAVERWFDTFHGNANIEDVHTLSYQREVAMRAALGQR